jgi:hypothetical protein
LKDIVVESCRLGIFQGSNGKFYPAGKLTNAEGVAVLSRIVAGFQPENGSHWADNYYNRANELNLLDNVNMNNKDGLATRGNVIISLYNASN